MERVIGYVDGFNLYFGLRSKGWKRFYWLDIQCMLSNLLDPHQVLVFTKYFTARISSPPEKQKRQSTYLEALETLQNLSIFYGRYQLNDQYCQYCGHVHQVPNEKMSDVNLAVEMLTDAFLDRFNTAFLVTADADLSAPITKVLELFPNKRVVVFFPPNRHSFKLKNVASAYYSISRGTLGNSLLPQEIRKPDGYILKCPTSWR